MDNQAAGVAQADIEDAQRLFRQGQIEQAERAYSRVLERLPDHVDALNVLAMAALRRGERPRAFELLLRATGVQPGHPVTWMNLGLAHQSGGDFAAALDAFTRALSNKPDNYVARLHKAAMLEKLGRGEQALPIYFGAITAAQQQGRWLGPSTTPPGQRELVTHAMRVVEQGRRDFFSNVLAPLRSRHGADALRRVEQCLASYLEELKLESPDPRQQPTFLYFPGLPPSPYLERGLFPWMDDFEAQTPAILEELLRVLPAEQGREAVFDRKDLAEANLRNDRGAAHWDGYYFYRHGNAKEDNCSRCPRTVAALQRLPLARIREHAPEVLFSVFAPGTHLLPHRGVTNTRLVAHLPLIVPPDCALRVAGETHVWRQGRGVVFDDTYEHEAWNRSAQTRVVLIVDIWNPHLTEAERDAVAQLIAAIGDLRQAAEAA